MKKILLFIFFAFSFFTSGTSLFAANIEDVFSDIDRDYEYYHELQSLYDKGMFSPDAAGNFNPETYLTREEFIGVMSEISCKKCIKPNVGREYFQKYKNSESFFDIADTNKYQYCIAGAKENKIISGYDAGTICEDGTGGPKKVPFCPKNTIILEEALAILLRTSGILSNQEAENIREKIRLGEQFPALADDVQATNNGYVYSFYPDFQKALDFKITEYDADGKQHTYFLLKKKGNFLFPDRPLTKEAFLQMAYVAMKGNSCIESNDNDLGVNINIFESECSEATVGTCKVSNLRKNTKVYDFFAKLGERNPSKKWSYEWRIYDFSNGTEAFRSGRYVDNYDFKKDGKYRVYLVITDDMGNSSEVYNDLTIGTGMLPGVGRLGNLKTSIQANPLTGKGPLRVNFSGIVSSGTGVTNYMWKFGDGSTANGINTSHIFEENGSYTVTFLVTDNKQNTTKATTVIEVKDDTTDTDTDGVPDSQDYEIRTPKTKVPFICTKEDIQQQLYGCRTTDLGVYNSQKETALSNSDTDGDGVKDYTDYEPNTDPDKIDTICTKADIELGRFGCRETDLGVATDRNNNPDAPDLGVEIQVYDKSCTKNTSNCRKATFGDGENTFDFGTETTLDVGENADITWTITNTDTGESTIVEDEYIDDYTFATPGEYDVSVTVTTDTGDTATATTHISVTENNTGTTTNANLSITIDATPLKTRPNSKIDFTAYTSVNTPKTIVWDFGDGNTNDGKNTTHSYAYEGIYTVVAEVADTQGNIKTASMVVYISNDIDDSDGDGVNDTDDNQINTPIDKIAYICTQSDIEQGRYGCNDDDLGVYNPEKDPRSDSDGDGILDSADQCPSISGVKRNLGCPIYEQTCKTKADCPDGYYCDGKYCRLQIIQTSCEYRGKGLFLGNAVCDTCPCEYGFDFRASIRTCDIVFPAITSKDEKNIFSKGNYYQIQQKK